MRADLVQRGTAAVPELLKYVSSIQDEDSKARLQSEFRFLIDSSSIRDDGAEDEHREWLIGVWAALAADHDFDSECQIL
jgi:hypothetical protein